jgi:signal transduction histidine kinase
MMARHQGFEPVVDDAASLSEVDRTSERKKLEGTGMPNEVLENLWKPLQTMKAEGIGMGLAIVKRIVDAHGGEITIASKQGAGTTVTMRLPLKPKMAS